jgi:hypothetical protein
VREGVDWRYIEFVDNQEVLDLVEGRMGLLDLLDEQCRFPTVGVGGNRSVSECGCGCVAQGEPKAGFASVCWVLRIHMLWCVSARGCPEGWSKLDCLKLVLMLDKQCRHSLSYSFPRYIYLGHKESEHASTLLCGLDLEILNRLVNACWLY